MTPQAIPKLNHLPSVLAREGAVCLELEDGVAIFRASTAVQTRIEELLQLEKESAITPAQKQELDAYEEIDDYLSFVNRTLRNLSKNPSWCLKSFPQIIIVSDSEQGI